MMINKSSSQIVDKIYVSKLNKVTTMAVCLSPILFIYRFLGLFMLGEIVLLILLCVNLLAQPNANRVLSDKQCCIFLFAIAIVSVSLIGYSINGLNIVVLPRLCRLMFCLFIVAILGGWFFDYQLAKKYVVWIAGIATCLIVLQYIYHDFTGKYIYFLLRDNIYSPVYNEGYFDNVEGLSTFRPMSVFLEPSHYCQYILFVLAMMLFSFKEKVKEVLFSAFLSVGIFLSTSSTGVLICIFLWIIYFFTIIKSGWIRKRLHSKTLLMLCIVVAVVGVLFGKFGDRFLFAITRIYNFSNSSSTIAWDSRLGTFSIFSEYSGTNFLFGRGYGVVNEGDWYASIPYYFSGLGIIGILIVGAFFTTLYFLSNRLQKKLTIIFVVLSFTTEVLTNYWLIFILSLIMTATDEERIENKWSEHL